MNIVDSAISHSRTTLSFLFLIFIVGAYAYVTIPKESSPDVNIPIIYVSLHHEGIQPEDAERLLLRPLEQNMRTIEGVKELKSFAYESGANIMLEFDAGFNAEKALTDVREQVDIAKSDLPQETDEPVVKEVNFSLFPVVVVTLSGAVTERALSKMAEDLKDRLEGIPSVLEAKIKGKREDSAEIVINPKNIESYGLSANEVFQIVARNNRLVAAGALDTGAGRFNIKVPGLIENVKDLFEIPIKVKGDRVITFGDIATIKRTFKDADSYARVNGLPAIALEVSKRSGENVIETIERVKATIEEERAYWPEGVSVDYNQDNSGQIRTMLSDLQNNIISAILLVMILIVGALGVRSSLLVGIAIPGSFLLGILIIWFAGLTVNVVVLFSLIMASGMLVDAAIVLVEYADRLMAEGETSKQAYSNASKRMAWPIISSTATTLAAFLPLVFWPGVVGQFMRYLPITMIATLSASLLMALVFIPTLGAYIGRRTVVNENLSNLSGEGKFDPTGLTGITGVYVRTVTKALQYPYHVIAGSVGMLFFVYFMFSMFSKGVEFFPNVEPDNSIVQIHARGNLAIDEQDRLVKQVEQKVLSLPYFKSIYSTSGQGSGNGGKFGQDVPEDVIGTIFMEFKDWQFRPKADQIFKEIYDLTKDLVGIQIEARKEEKGPPTGKAVQLQVRSRFPEQLDVAIRKIDQKLRSMQGLRNIENDLPPPGIEWEVRVDRSQAAKFGVDVQAVGDAIRLVTNGIKISEYRPNDTDEEVDILVRFPKEFRNLKELDNLRVQSSAGLVPLSNFVVREPLPRVGRLKRVDGQRAMFAKADVEAGVLPDDKVKELAAWIKKERFPEGVLLKFKGEDEEQKKAQTFLGNAFLVAIFIMAVILITEFNSFYSTFLVLSTVIMSTIGVLIGLMITGLPFGIVMNGIGVVSLAGIVVNNNIILIDTYDTLKKVNPSTIDALLHTGAQRLRPVLLTTVTTVLGLLPMMFGLSIDFVTREVSLGAPSTQWWNQLATSIVFGLSFSTVLTLIVTPCALLARENFRVWFRAYRAKRVA